ncbi:DUF4179 domain-containing protein [Robertmurraya massiliosenegalensis]|uniref:DUF4179 domain-containing protein n=1 Tax=Robertmurraya massiliosenegalensis TaxID=1287657 RepID=UPI0002FCA1ED|nr:DUF4179 domain-containing protein [Robertmurraya massiliosenegalensis]
MKEKFLQEIFEQVEVPKEDVRQSIRIGIQRAEIKVKKKNHLLRILPAAAVLFLTTVITLGFSFPSFAEKLPVIGNIFKLFEDNDREYIFEEYDSYTTKLDITEESNGVRITLTEAVYDGENITIAYMIDSEHDLGEEPIIESDPNYFKELHGQTSGTQLTKKLDEHKYAGIYTVNILNGNRPDSINFTLEGISIFSLEDRKNQTEGNWSFNFTLDKVESDIQKFENRVTKGEGMEVELKNMTTTPISTSFYFNQSVDRKVWREEKLSAVFFDYELSDNLGNVYTMVTNGSFGSDIKKSGRAITTEIAEDATAIFITPTVTSYKETSKGENGVELELAKPPFKLETIEIPLH